jgi:hypothetical protein
MEPSLRNKFRLTKQKISGKTKTEIERIILWHVNSLLGKDREISNYTTAVAK